MNVRLLTLLHLVLTELRPFYAILFSANLMLKSTLATLMSIFITTDTFKGGTDNGTPYVVSVLEATQCVNTIAPQMLWASTGKEYTCTYDRLSKAKLVKGEVACARQPCETVTPKINAPGAELRSYLGAGAMASFDFLVAANYIVFFLTLAILVTVFVLIAKEKAAINSWKYVATTMKVKANKRYILLIKCLIATFYSMSFGVFVMLLMYKGPVLEFFVQFAVLMVSAFGLKLTGSKLPLDLDNPKLASIEFDRVPQGKGGRKLTAALFGLLNMNNETYFQQFANALGEAKNLGDSAAVRTMLANPDKSVPLLMSNSVGSTTSNQIYATTDTPEQEGSAAEQQGQL